MSRRDLRANLSKLQKPTLVIQYELAHRAVLGVDAFVSKRQYARFADRQKDFEDYGIDPRAYAKFALNHMRKWVHDKGFKRLPVNTFLGAYLIERYIIISCTETVRPHIDDISDVILHDELLVARTYIEHNRQYVCTMKHVIEAISIMLSDAWKRSYKSGDRPIRDAMKILSSEYHVSGVSDYDDIVSVLNGR